jgi:hypothetical protein
MKATMTRTAHAQPVGEYARTALDDAKDSADILITGCFKKRTEIRTRKILSGHGIKMESISNGVGRYTVNDAALDELRRRFTVFTDF